MNKKSKYYKVSCYRITIQIETIHSEKITAKKETTADDFVPDLKSEGVITPDSIGICNKPIQSGKTVQHKIPSVSIR